MLQRAGATPKRRIGKAWRSARDPRAGQSGEWGLQGSWESLLSPRPEPDWIIPAYQDPGSPARFPLVIAKKEKEIGVSDAERNAKARETGKGQS